jgi:hypothetical protein
MTAETLDKPLADYLPDVGEALHAQLIELHKRQSPDAAERVAYNLEGARKMVLAVRAEMLRVTPA